MPDKKHFFLKLNPSRPSFAQDMSDEELAIMQRHVNYWQPFIENGTVIVFGPVADPKGVFGMAVLALDDEQKLDELVANDPANGLSTYEIYPMRAVTKQA